MTHGSIRLASRLSTIVVTLTSSSILLAQTGAADTKAPPAAAKPADVKPAAAKPAAVTPPPVVAPPVGGTPGVPQPVASVQLKPGEVPQVDFDTPVYDFGKIPAGKDVTHDFWFSNPGNGPLEILAVRPSCGCTTAGDFDHVVQPGKTGKIPIKVATGHFNGPVTKTVSIQTNVTGVNANVVLQVKGELWQIVQIQPQSVYFGRVLVGEAATAKQTQTLTITTSNNAIAKITDLKSSNPVFKGDLTEVEPGKKFNLVVSMVPPLKEGNNYGTIEMNTGVAELPKLQVPVSVLVAPELEITPNQLVLTANVKTAMKRPILIRNNSTKPMKVTDLACNNSNIKLDLKEATPGSLWQVMVDIPENYAKADPTGDKITFKTDKPGSDVVTVPVVEQQAFGAPPVATALPVSPTATPAITKVPPATATVTPARATAATPAKTGPITPPVKTDGM